MTSATTDGLVTGFEREGDKLLIEYRKLKLMREGFSAVGAERIAADFSIIDSDHAIKALRCALQQYEGLEAEFMALYLMGVNDEPLIMPETDNEIDEQD
jgi:hypothetical protein